MLDLTFGEQVKIILSRKGMTIKELAEIIEERTGKKMSRQNLTQRLGRDNFQEQDMRMIAEILECPFQLSILGEAKAEEEKESKIASPTEAELTLLARKKKRKENKAPAERDITIGELMDIHQSLDELQEAEISAKEDVAVKQEEIEAAAPEEEATEISASENEAAEAAEETYEEEAAEEDYIEEPAEAEEVTEDYAAETADEGFDSQAAWAETEMAEDIQEEVQAETEESQEEQPEEREKPVKKARGGWRDFFQRRVRREEPKQEQSRSEEPQAAIAEENLPEAEEELSAYEGDILEEQQDAAEETAEEMMAEEAGLPEEELEQLAKDPEEEDLERGDVNPYTGHEYETNTVRMHPKRIGYVQVYDRSNHQWTDMTEWAFLGYQERKKALLGKDYEPPIYLD